MASRAMWRQYGRMTGKNWLTDQLAGMETMLISTLLSRRIPRAIACSHNFRAEDGSRSIGLRIIARFLYARKFRRTRAIYGLYTRATARKPLSLQRVAQRSLMVAASLAKM